jgi:hypothetical protein
MLLDIINKIFTFISVEWGFMGPLGIYKSISFLCFLEEKSLRSLSIVRKNPKLFTIDRTVVAYLMELCQNSNLNVAFMGGVMITYNTF